MVAVPSYAGSITSVLHLWYLRSGSPFYGPNWIWDIDGFTEHELAESVSREMGSLISNQEEQLRRQQNAQCVPQFITCLLIFALVTSSLLGEGLIGLLFLFKVLLTISSHRIYRSFNPLPSRICGIHFSTLDSRVLDCLG